MEGRLVLKGCCLCDGEGSLRRDRAVVVEDGRISKVAPDAQIPVLPGDWEVACRGRLLLPGLIDCHAELVSGQLSPLAVQAASAPADRALAPHDSVAELTCAEVEALTAFALARALRAGVTTVFEQVRCPADVRGALEVQGRTAERLGVRLVCSHATDGGDPRALAQLEANAEQARARKTHPLVRVALGFRESAEWKDELFSQLGCLRRQLGVGVHGTLGCREVARAGAEPVDTSVLSRLESDGLLGRDCVLFSECTPELGTAKRIAATGTLWAVSLFRSSMKGFPPGEVEAFLGSGGLVLCTAGSISLWDQLAVAFAALRHGRPADADARAMQVFFRSPASLCCEVFGGRIGVIEPGGEADLVVYDLVPGEGGWPLTADLLRRAARAPVAWTIVAGRVVVREGRLLAHDFVELDREAQGALNAIRARQAVRGVEA